jgi:NADH-quinone oxidoreductase subunit C
VDYPEDKKITSVYILFSSRHGHKVEVRVDLDRDDPRVATVSDLWRGCEWFERETYDMFGVVFENHPDLRRIMLTDDWVGWPLRKDYQDSRIAPKPY